MRRLLEIESTDPFTVHADDDRPKDQPTRFWLAELRERTVPAADLQEFFDQQVFFLYFCYLECFSSFVINVYTSAVEKRVLPAAVQPPARRAAVQ
jgi:hypothetical protein